jgi:putative endonuclease
MRNLFNKLFRRSNPSGHNIDLGARGEHAAARHLRKRGYKILVRRYRCDAGEIDIVARHKDTLVFVEVKTRRGEQFGAPSEAVDDRKKNHISRVAFDYLRRLEMPRIRWRFDIVEVIWPDGAAKPSDVRIIQNAFDLPEPFLY